MNLFQSAQFDRSAPYTAFVGFITGSGFSEEAVTQRISDILSESGVTAAYELQTVSIIGKYNLTATIKTSYSGITFKMAKGYGNDSYTFEIFSTSDDKQTELGKFIDIAQPQTVD